MVTNMSEQKRGGPARTRTWDLTVMSAEKIPENRGKPDSFVQSRSISLIMISRTYFLTVSRRVSDYVARPSALA
jgi:hypothetical protein